jgi:[acyl-carrier-protein] S-malonyltransferase
MLSHFSTGKDYAFLFPGVGMQYNKLLPLLGGLDLAGLRAACGETCQVLGIDVWDYINNRCEDCADQELMEQISIYTVNCFVFREYVKRGIKPGALIGYSLGIYSALYCSGAIKYNDGINLVVAAYNLMKDFPRKNEKWGMAVIVGLDCAQVLCIINALHIEENTSIINENNQYSVVITGLEESIGLACLKAEEEGALSVKQLPVSMPYHTGFMSEPAERFHAYADTMVFQDPGIPLISTITQDVIQSAAGVKQDLILNIKTRMSWSRTIEKAAQIGFRDFFEVGLCDSICKLSAFINPGYKFLKCRDVFKERLDGVS